MLAKVYCITLANHFCCGLLKKLLAYIIDHLKAEFNLTFFLLYPLLIAALTGVIYSGRLNNILVGDGSVFIWLSIYSGLYLAVTIIYATLYKKTAALQKAEFWILGLLIVSALYLNQFFRVFDYVWQQLPKPLLPFFYAVFYNLQVSILYILVPLFWFYWKRESTPFYGLSVRGFDYKPYLFMLLIMVPLLCWASFQPSFLAAYPRYRAGESEVIMGLSPWLTISGFELTYIIQFITLELFFRGFMVMAIGKFFGNGSVWIMTAMYVLIHFGKPLPETIGAFFGGYLLGVIALRTQSIFGGVMVHLGVALIMELFAYFQFAAR
jgi:membrane protease YdiL (CAAX protease family)